MPPPFVPAVRHRIFYQISIVARNIWTHVVGGPKCVWTIFDFNIGLTTLVLNEPFQVKWALSACLDVDSLNQEGTYTFVNIVILFSLSHGIGFFFIALMALRFFAWFRHWKEIMALWYGLTMCIIIAFLGSSIIYAAYEFSKNIYPDMTSRLRLMEFRLVEWFIFIKYDYSAGILVDFKQ